MSQAVQIDLSMLDEVSNKSFYPLFLCKDRYMVMFGGAGSGKSFFAAEKILIRIMKAMAKGKKHKFLCMRKTKPAARKSIFALFNDYITNWGLRSSVKINQTDMTITFLGGSEIIITGIDDPEKIKSIHGVTGVWLEEATEFSYDDFKQIDLRLRGQTWDYKQIILSFNPIDEQHWIRQQLFNDDLQDKIESGQKTARLEYSSVIDAKTITYGLTAMHSTYQDNRFLDDVYKARLENLIHEDSNYYKIYTLGKWGLLRGLIFEHFQICENWPAEFDVSGHGMDFGFAVDPTAIVEAGFIGDNLYLREKLYETKLTNRDIAERLLTITAASPTRLTVADAAEPKSITEINQYGHPCIPAAKGPDSVMHGIQRMRQFSIFLDYNSPNLIKEFGGYKWAEDKNGNFLNKPVKFNDHLIDAARYIVTKLKGVQVSLQVMNPEKTAVEKYADAVHKIAQAEETEITIDENDDAIWQDF